MIPPVQPDVPGQGVPLCISHTDPYNPPARRYKTVVSHPLTDSNIQEFGQWLTGERWDVISETYSPYNNKQLEICQSMINQKVEEIFPQRKVKKKGLTPRSKST